MQQYANIYLLLNYSTCFGPPSRPSSGVHQTVVAASGTDHTIWGAIFLKRDQIRTDTAFGSCSKSSLVLLVITINTDVDVGWCRFPKSTCFVVPCGCIRSVQIFLLFDIKLLDNIWLFGIDKFYIRVSVRCNSGLKKSNKMQQKYADIYLLLNYSTCFGRASRPSSGVHKTVFAASGTDHTIWWASFLKRDQIKKITVQLSLFMPYVHTGVGGRYTSSSTHSYPVR